MTFTAPVSTELIVTQCHCMEIFYPEFHPDMLRNTERTGRNLYSPVTWRMAVIRPISTKLEPLRQIFKRIRAPSLVANTR
jgi:hypothetical protein